MLKPKNWIDFADDDLAVAQSLLKNEPRIGAIVYHAQQCVEKSLKAYIFLMKVNIPRTHDLEKLLEICLKYDPTFIDLNNICIELTPFATGTRYPDDSFIFPDLSVAEYSVQQAQEVLDFVKSKI